MKTAKIAAIATAVTIVIIALCGAATAETRPEYYPKLAVVVELEKVGELHVVTCQDMAGNRWEFFDDEGFWKVGDLANLLMWATGEIEEDDEIVEVYWEGHIDPANLPS